MCCVAIAGMACLCGDAAFAGMARSYGGACFREHGCLCGDAAFAGIARSYGGAWPWQSMDCRATLAMTAMDCRAVLAVTAMDCHAALAMTLMPICPCYDYMLD